MSLNWNFQRGGGFKPRKPSMGGVWIFSKTTQSRKGQKGRSHQNRAATSDYSMTETSSGTRDYRNAYQTLKKGEHMFLWYHLKSV